MSFGFTWYLNSQKAEIITPAQIEAQAKFSPMLELVAMSSHFVLYLVEWVVWSVSP